MKPFKCESIVDGKLLPGEVWAVVPGQPGVNSEWCLRVAREDEDVVWLGFGQQAKIQQSVGWTQARYYGDEGETVRDYLSYETVFDINPFEVGAKRHISRREYAMWRKELLARCGLENFLARTVYSLSNGETRRLLIARALAARPRKLVLDDPAAGLDAEQRSWLKEMIGVCAGWGISVVVACRHLDEYPPGVTQWISVGRDGCARLVAAPQYLQRKELMVSHRIVTQSVIKCLAEDNLSEPVIEINSLNLSYEKKVLFKNFCWTVRRGERWLLRGENGSGKTTLFALISGDSPMAYAADVRVFGHRRGDGIPLAEIRQRIGMVSPEMQACSGTNAHELVENALRREPELLLLDEPFFGLTSAESKILIRRLERWLAARPSVTAILISHRDDELPANFNRELCLGNFCAI